MSRRSITAKQRDAILVANHSTCHLCGGVIDPTSEGWDVSHEIPLAIGGSDDESNWRAAHRKCHRHHTANVDAPRIAKTVRQGQKDRGVRRSRTPMGHPLLRRKMDGTVVEK